MHSTTYPAAAEYGGGQLSYSAGGGGSYPVYRDATMNPRYPLTTSYDTHHYQPRPSTTGAGIGTGTGTGAGTGTWMSGTGRTTVPAAAVHQPRPATVTSNVPTPHPPATAMAN